MSKEGREFAWVPYDEGLTKRYKVTGIPGNHLPVAKLIIMEPDRSGYGLYVFGEKGLFLGDSYHKRREKALKEAKDIFNVGPTDWHKDHTAMHLNDFARSVFAQQP